MRTEDAGGGSRGTPEALIEAARGLFTEHGFDAASVRAITAAAGVNLGAITYHFGSKQALYERVIEACVRPLAERVEAVAHGDGTPLERVAGVVRAYFGYLAENPDVPHLLVQALATAAAPPETFARYVRRVHGAMVGIVLEGQEDGSVRPGNPIQMAIGIISHPLHVMLLRPQLRAVLGWDLDDPAVRAEAVEGAVAFACGGLAARPGGGEVAP